MMDLSTPGQGPEEGERIVDRKNEGWRDKMLTAYTPTDNNKLVAYAVEKCPRCEGEIFGPQGKFEFQCTVDQEMKFARTGLVFRRTFPAETELDDMTTGRTVCVLCYKYAQSLLGAGEGEKS